VCQDCTLRYEDLPDATVQQFFSDFENGLCSCLCLQEGCGPLQGGGGVVGDPGFETEGDAASDTAETTGGDGTGGTDSTGSTSG
jgi:hypothetical protein